MSSGGTSRSVKVQPFPKDVKPADKLFRWKYWLQTFRMAMEQNRVDSQRNMAIELSLSAGDEVGMIIMTEDLFVSAEEGGVDFRYYDYLVEGVTRFFGKLTDSGTNVREFNHLKQSDGETVREYSLRSKMVAQKIGLTNEAMLVVNFVDGLQDSEVRKWAIAFSWSMEDIIRAATQRENKLNTQASPWNDSDNRPVTLAAVNRHQEGGRKREEVSGGARTGYKRERSNERSDKRSDKQAGGGKYDNMRDGKCKACGKSSHKGYGYPALKAQCYKCGEIGHFSAACSNKKIRNVYSSGNEAKVRVFPNRDN